jgi:hypothetical protein
VKRLASSLLASALVAALALTSLACSKKPSEEECEKLVRHIIELEAAEAGGGAVPADQRADAEQRKKSVFKAVGTKYCVDDMPVEQVHCALEAKNLAELSAKCEKS